MRKIMGLSLVFGKERVTPNGNPGLALCLAFSPDGKTLATESYGKQQQGNGHERAKSFDGKPLWLLVLKREKP
jgi:hypothetical protein